MRRRNYLAAITGSGASLLAGCTSSSPSSSPSTQTETTTTSGSPSFEVVEVSAPGSVAIGEPARIDIEVENTGGASGTWTGDLFVYATYGPEPEDWSEISAQLEIPAGERQTWTSGEIVYEEPVLVYYRLGDRGAETIDIPGSKAPIMTETNLVSGWETFGDAIDNRIAQTSVGSTVSIASRYWYWAENQTNDTFRQVEIYDAENNRVAIRTDSDEQVTESNGWAPWESYLAFDSAGWGTGTYTAEMLIRDNQNQEVSDVGSVEFELTEE